MANDILIVDDEADIRMLIAGILEDEGYDSRSAANAREALDAIRRRMPSLVILDIWLQNSHLDGIGILDEIHRDHPDLPVIMISGHGTIETAVTAIKKGAYDFIEKPFKADRLLFMIERAVEAARLRRENSELRRRAGSSTELIGISPGVNAVRSAIEKVAPTGSRVLITGPAGAGKEVVARRIHERSRRAGGPFVVLNCATLTPERLESELFGTEPGGREPRTVGTLELAHKGTLLLDEVADMPIETQGKILRVLQEQAFRRIGGDTEVEVDVRVIAATNRDLQQEMGAGRFREDLFYRLNVVPIRVPPLRERREDVPMLARHFVRQTAESGGMAVRALGEDAIAALQAYDWPGNVRQLRNVIDWILIMASGDPRESIRADQLPPEIGSATPATLKWEKGGEIMGMALREARETFEREYLISQVNRFGGNISRTAAFIGMERSALHRKLKSLGVFQGEKLVRPAG
ncbi:sigma-54-dependent Fis family transcriptional regulator [Thalassobaculum fulvum]|uniref:Sigma-54-dependent Fis family transcriptional regulator n=1 Tax=Thalassobaculum fulvum TaxID=1633335 RepID=A0A918XQJ8_9PROT|nr:sigma-54 dependent transcriptional regulator [Thalassobaculum fulvum]GHD47413.1 sigma-54-dependent Fis family transcriptional regulator [Thalassobaculum fulvum]